MRSHSRRNQVFVFTEAGSLFSLVRCLWVRYPLPPSFSLGCFSWFSLGSVKSYQQREVGQRDERGLKTWWTVSWRLNELGSIQTANAHWHPFVVMCWSFLAWCRWHFVINIDIQCDCVWASQSHQINVLEQVMHAMLTILILFFQQEGSNIYISRLISYMCNRSICLGFSLRDWLFKKINRGESVCGTELLLSYAVTLC